MGGGGHVVDGGRWDGGGWQRGPCGDAHADADVGVIMHVCVCMCICASTCVYTRTATRTDERMDEMCLGSDKDEGCMSHLGAERQMNYAFLLRPRGLIRIGSMVWVHA